jgi:superoxide reductase
MKFMYCKHCGNVVAFVEEKQPKIICCGEPMTELVPNTTDAAKEKHVPVIKKEGSHVTVTVGSVPHPMEETHYIEWIVLETKDGRQRKCLKAGDKPEATFALVKGDEVVAAYAYCNKHGLWKA